MNKSSDYTFKIDGLTPKEMPFGRLLDYYAQIKTMLGVAGNLHLVAITESSHASAFKIDREYESELDKRLLALRDGKAPKLANRAVETINEMLREDGTSGSFADPYGSNVIQFPGKEAESSSRYKIREQATLVGYLYHIAGTRDDHDAKVRLSTGGQGVVFCTTTREVAKGLRDFLFERVQVTGQGTWTRQLNGLWTVQDLAITDFKPVRDESLRQTISRLREINVDWPDDPLQALADVEETDRKVH